MPFGSAADAAAERQKRLKDAEIGTIEELYALLALVKSDPRKLQEIDFKKLRTGLRFLDDLSDSDTDKLWAMLIKHPEGFKYCVGRNVQSANVHTTAGGGGGAAVSKSDTIKAVLLDVSGSMSYKPFPFLVELVKSCKRLVSGFLSKGHRVLVYYFGNSYAIPPYTGEQFVSGQYDPVFNDGATCLEQTINRIDVLVKENPDKFVDVIIVTDGGISDSGRGANVTGLRGAAVIVCENLNSSAAVRESHIRTLERQLCADIVTVHNPNPYDSLFARAFSDIVDGLLTTASLPPGITSVNGLQFPRVLLTDPNLIVEVITSAACNIDNVKPVCEFLETLLNAVNTAANTSFVSILEGRLSGILRVVQSIRITTERVTAGCDDKEVLKNLDKVFVLAKSVQDNLSNLKANTVKQLMTSGQHERADKVNKKYAELTQFDESEDLLAAIGDATHKLVFGGKVIGTPEGRALLTLLLRESRTIESLSARERSMVIGMFEQVKKVPMTGAEKHHIPYSLKKPLEVFRLLGFIAADADTKGFTYSMTTASRILLFCQDATEKRIAKFSPDFAELIESAIKKIPEAVLKNLTDLGPTSLSNRTFAWMKLMSGMRVQLPGSQEFSRLLLIAATSLACKNGMFEPMSKTYQVELPKCPFPDITELYCTLSDSDKVVDTGTPPPRTQVEIDNVAKAGSGRRCKRKPSRMYRKKRRNGNQQTCNEVVLVQKTPTEILTDKLVALGFNQDAVTVFVELRLRAVKSGLSMYASTPEEQLTQANAIREYMRAQPPVMINRTELLSSDEVFREVLRIAMDSVHGELREVLENFSNASLKNLRNLAPNAVLELMYNKQPSISSISYHPVFTPKLRELADQIVDSVKRITESKPQPVVTPDEYFEHIRSISTSAGDGGGGAEPIAKYGIDESCPICLENASTVAHKCGHALCRDCFDLMKKYLDEQGKPFTCPCCRAT